MRLPLPVRYVLIAVLIGMSFLPPLLTGGVLGGINLLFLAALWALMFLCFLRTGRAWASGAVVLGAFVMAVPPVPNYVSPSGEQGAHFRFVGWGNLLEGGGLYGIVFFLVFYAVLFGAVYWLLKRSRPAR
ncbi:hypothetical protein CAI18_00675 [Xanthomonas citri pv. punicae]|nr:hypothetical protein CAI14_20495 [Xanthomonas citri pv. punicae]QCZ70235.1 hypothetical protein CAI17_18130 [Xanthomonas citri pv. punicae]QCZ73590.1 hypothetical protein CAB38_13530 [Xanthomonas citri pv. punicae]QCZ79100.1 hypothetical protein XapA_22440 [Xanthomonas citri pv. punicae]QCZ80111.1 hypothetical protein XapB_02955 [Xanthomonas citri pv. punicae]